MPQAPNAPDNGAESHGEVTIPEGWASVLFDKAFELSESYSKLVKARKANRESLRSLEAQGLLSDAEREELEELYPGREVVRRTDEERAAELEARAKQVREKAKKRAEEAKAAQAG